MASPCCVYEQQQVELPRVVVESLRSHTQLGVSSIPHSYSTHTNYSNLCSFFLSFTLHLAPLTSREAKYFLLPLRKWAKNPWCVSNQEEAIFWPGSRGSPLDQCSITFRAPLPISACTALKTTSQKLTNVLSTGNCWELGYLNSSVRNARRQRLLFFFVFFLCTLPADHRTVTFLLFLLSILKEIRRKVEVRVCGFWFADKISGK